jgi:hypothetical protein
MHDRLGDISYARSRHARALFPGNRVVRGLQFDEGRHPSSRMATWAFKLIVLGA